MDRALTDHEKFIKAMSESKNPYDIVCPNRHLWSEGFRAGFDQAELVQIGACGRFEEDKMNIDNKKCKNCGCTKFQHTRPL